MPIQNANALVDTSGELVFSIVLCTRNRAALLKQALESLLEIDYPTERFELILVDNASSDDTERVAKHFAERARFAVRCVVEQKIGLSAARNRGIREARGRYVFFTDDDQLVDPAILREHERVAEKFGARVVQGAIELVFTNGRPDWLRGPLAGLLGENAPEPEGPTAPSLRGGNLVVRRDLFAALGAFREDLGKGRAGYSEDTELALRLKRRGELVVHAPRARILHVIEPVRANAAYFLRSSFEKGKSHVLAERYLPSRRKLAGITVQQVWGFGLDAVRHGARAERHESMVAQTNAAFCLGKLAGYAQLTWQEQHKPPAEPSGKPRAVEIDRKLEKLLHSPPVLHRDSAGNPVNYGVDARLIARLCKHVQPGNRTLETGSGISTIAFLLLGAEHRSVSPEPEEAARIRTYCAEQGIDASSYTPLVSRSEELLPTLPEEPALDVVLIDGDHAFCVPCIDWYFTTRLLKSGGVMIVDDIHLWSGKILADFLDMETVWEKLERTERFAAYRMRTDAEQVLGQWWGQQPIVQRSHEEYVARNNLPKRVRRSLAQLASSLKKSRS